MIVYRLGHWMFCLCFLVHFLGNARPLLYGLSVVEMMHIYIYLFMYLSIFQLTNLHFNFTGGIKYECWSIYSVFFILFCINLHSNSDLELMDGMLSIFVTLMVYMSATNVILNLKGDRSSVGWH